MYDDGRGQANRSWRALLWEHQGKLIGALLGLLEGLLILHYGLARALFLTALTVAGYGLGGRWDEAQEWWRQLRERLRPKGPQAY